jgi:hypothetical protein
MVILRMGEADFKRISNSSIQSYLLKYMKIEKINKEDKQWKLEKYW